MSDTFQHIGDLANDIVKRIEHERRDACFEIYASVLSNIWESMITTMHTDYATMLWDEATKRHVHPE